MISRFHWVFDFDCFPKKHKNKRNWFLIGSYFNVTFRYFTYMCYSSRLFILILYCSHCLRTIRCKIHELQTCRQRNHQIKQEKERAINNVHFRSFFQVSASRNSQNGDRSCIKNSYIHKIVTV